MIINQSGIVIRLSVAECRVMGRATQGVRLINLAKKNDVIASVCKVMSAEMEEQVEEESRSQWNKSKRRTSKTDLQEAAKTKLTTAPQTMKARKQLLHR